MMKNYKVASLITGLLIWLLATIAFRIAGQYFFIADDPLILVSLYILIVPILYLIAYFLIMKYQLSNAEPAVATSLLVLPGMVLDTFVILFFNQLLPNLPARFDAEFASWLIWAYAIVIIVGVIKSK